MDNSEKWEEMDKGGHKDKIAFINIDKGDPMLLEGGADQRRAQGKDLGVIQLDNSEKGPTPRTMERLLPQFCPIGQNWTNAAHKGKTLNRVKKNICLPIHPKRNKTARKKSEKPPILGRKCKENC